MFQHSTVYPVVIFHFTTASPNEALHASSPSYSYFRLFTTSLQECLLHLHGSFTWSMSVVCYRY